MSEPLKEDHLIRIKSTIEPRVGQDEKTETVELMTLGDFIVGDDSYKIVYNETGTTGYAGCTTALKISKDGSRVSMMRYGKAEGAGTHLFIEKGKRNQCHYETGYGSLTLGITADEIRSELTDEGGHLRFAYLLDAGIAELVSRNLLEITVTKRI